MSAARSATRAASRRRSSRTTRNATTLISTATASEAIVTITINPIPSPELELDRDLDDHIDRSAEALRGRKAPLSHRLNRAIVQAAGESFENLDVGHRSLARDDNLEYDFTSDAAQARLFGV